MLMNAQTNVSSSGAGQHRQSAFTLTELVAVLCVLVLLGVVLAPVLGRTHPAVSAVQCLNNLRQLSVAWKMYADDSRGKLAPNADGPLAGRNISVPSWAGGYLDFTSSTDNTNTELLLNHSAYPNGAYLGAYVRTPLPYRCPADTSKFTNASPPVPRVRTVSMSNRVGDQASSWSGVGTTPMFPTLCAASAVRSSDLFVFVEEREDSINDPVFIVDPDTPYTLVNIPAAYHGAAGTFGFADGHSELHRWVDPRTTPVLGSVNINIYLKDDPDVAWLQKHSIATQ